jgi:carbonic anhydrase
MLVSLFKHINLIYVYMFILKPNAYTMETTLKEILNANLRYAQEFGDKDKLQLPPAKKIAVLTCMDARLDPAKFAGFNEGDAHIIRNAGGRASDDAIRSLVISHKLLGTDKWFVIHHSDCGMETFTNEIMGNLLEDSLETATIDARGWKNVSGDVGSPEGKYINWLTIAQQERSIIEDVNRIKNHPLVSEKISVTGLLIDVKTGKLHEVFAAGK